VCVNKKKEEKEMANIIQSFLDPNTLGITSEYTNENLLIPRIFSNNDGSFVAIVNILDDDGKKIGEEVVAWGNAEYGGKIPESVQEKLQGQTIRHIYSTGGAFAALLNNGRVVVWGNINYGGEIREDVQNELKNVKNIYTTNEVFTALLGNGQVITWGDPHFIKEHIQPELKDKVVKRIYSNREVFVGLLTDNQVVMWGNPDMIKPIPEEFLKDEKVIDIYSTDGAWAALLEGGKLIAWGNKDYGGNKWYDKDVASVYTTYRAFAVIFKNGQVAAWGHDDFGGKIPKSTQDELNSVKKIYSTYNAFVALTTEGKIITWDALSFKQLSYLRRYFPYSRGQVKEIYTSREAFLALLYSGDIIAWGNKDYGGFIPINVRKEVKEYKIKNILSSAESGGFALELDNGTIVAWGFSKPEGIIIPKIYGRELIHILFSNDNLLIVYSNGEVEVVWKKGDMVLSNKADSILNRYCRQYLCHNKKDRTKTSINKRYNEFDGYREEIERCRKKVFSTDKHLRCRDYELFTPLPPPIPFRRGVPIKPLPRKTENKWIVVLQSTYDPNGAFDENIDSALFNTLENIHYTLRKEGDQIGYFLASKDEKVRYTYNIRYRKFGSLDDITRAHLGDKSKFEKDIGKNNIVHLIIMAHGNSKSIRLGEHESMTIPSAVAENRIKESKENFDILSSWINTYVHQGAQILLHSCSLGGGERKNWAQHLSKVLGEGKVRDQFHEYNLILSQKLEKIKKMLEQEKDDAVKKYLEAEYQRLLEIYNNPTKKEIIKRGRTLNYTVIAANKPINRGELGIGDEENTEIHINRNFPVPTIPYTFLVPGKYLHFYVNGELVKTRPKIQFDPSDLLLHRRESPEGAVFRYDGDGDDVKVPQPPPLEELPDRLPERLPERLLERLLEELPPIEDLGPPLPLHRARDINHEDGGLNFDNIIPRAINFNEDNFALPPAHPPLNVNDGDDGDE